MNWRIGSLLSVRRWRSHLSERPDMAAVLHNIGWLAADKIGRMAVGVIVGAWVARYLGPDLFGQLAYVLAFLAFFQVAAQFGLDSIVVRDITHAPQDAGQFLGTTFWLRLGMGLTGWVLAILGMAFLRPGDTTALVLTAIAGSAVALQASDTIDLWFQSQNQSRRTVQAKAVAYLAANGLRVALILSGAGLVAFAAVAAVEAAFGALALVVSYRRRSAGFVWRISVPVIRRLASEGWPLMMSGLATMIYMRLDQIMLREMRGTSELGIFSAAVPLSTAWYFLPTIILISVFPTLSRTRREKLADYYRQLQHLLNLMWLVSIPIVIGTALIAHPLVILLYGPAFEKAGAVLIIHVVSTVPVALGLAQSAWVVNEGLGRLSLIKTGCGAVVNIGLNLLLIGRYGALGAAVATVVSQFVAAVLTNIVLAPRIFLMQLGLQRFIRTY